MGPYNGSSFIALKLKGKYRFLEAAMFFVLLKTKKKNSVVLVRKRTIPTERPQPADKVSANFS
jgi:hypothetical protein